MITPMAYRQLPQLGAWVVVWAVKQKPLEGPVSHKMLLPYAVQQGLAQPPQLRLNLLLLPDHPDTAPWLVVLLLPSSLVVLVVDVEAAVEERGGCCCRRPSYWHVSSHSRRPLTVMLLSMTTELRQQKQNIEDEAPTESHQ